MNGIPASLCLPLAMGLSLSHAPAWAQSGEPQPPGFTIKEERPETGSNIRRDSVSGALPYDKKYGELTPEQQLRLRSRYVEMGEGDEPPFPAEGLGPLYTAIARANDLAGAVAGKLDMDVFVDEAGRATKVVLIKSPDPRLSRHVAAIAMLTRFKPALCKGKPCAMGFPISIVFARR